MTESTALSIISASIGFVSAIFFCIGNAFNSAKQIISQASTYWNFNESLARSLAAQRAQYVTGAMLLVISFGLQVAATQASSINPVNLPQYVHTWPCLVLAVLVPTLLLGGVCSYGFYKQTESKIRKHIEKRKKESSEISPKSDEKV